jgi:hypothetical protein
MKEIRAKLEQKLEAMKGKTWLVKTFHNRLVNYRIEADTVEIVTDRNFYDWTHARALQELDTWLPCASGTELTNRGDNGGEIAIAGVALKGLIETLNDSIEKVKENPEYVKQATSINCLAKTIINAGTFVIRLNKSAEA